MVSKTLRAAAVIVTTGLVVATGGGVANAAGKASTSLSIRAVTHTQYAIVSGSLLHGRTALPDAAVVLDARPAGSDHFAAVQSEHTGRNGGVSFTVTPARTTRYELRFAGDGARQPSHSGVVTVRAPKAAVASSLSIRVSKDSIAKGERDQVSGVLQIRGAALANRRVVLLGRPVGSGSWTRQAASTTGPKGWVGFIVTPAASRQFALAFAGDAVGKASRSGVVTVFVRTPTSLSIRSSESSVDPGGSAQISGVLLAGGHPVADHEIRLLTRAPGGAWSVLARARTGAHGGVAFTVKPSATAGYALDSLRSARFEASRSGIVTVLVRLATTLSLTADSASVPSGTSTTLHGLLQSGSDPLTGRDVTLFSRAAGTTDWTAGPTFTTDSAGAVTVTVTPSTKTEYQLGFAQTPRYLASRSSTVTVDVVA